MFKYMNDCDYKNRYKLKFIIIQSYQKFEYRKKYRNNE